MRRAAAAPAAIFSGNPFAEHRVMVRTPIAITILSRATFQVRIAPWGILYSHFHKSFTQTSFTGIRSSLHSAQDELQDTLSPAVGIEPWLTVEAFGNRTTEQKRPRDRLDDTKREPIRCRRHWRRTRRSRSMRRRCSIWCAHRFNHTKAGQHRSMLLQP